MVFGNETACFGVKIAGLVNFFQCKINYAAFLAQKITDYYMGDFVKAFRLK